MAAKGSFPTPRGARVATLEFAETFHKTPALVAYAVVMIVTAPIPKPVQDNQQDDRAFA